MSLFPKFKASMASPATPATQPLKSSRSSKSSRPPDSGIELAVSQEPASWPCPRCGAPAQIESVEPRQSDGVLLTFWHCPPCQTWAVTPGTLREPPKGWVLRREQ
jgi:hypothetical protein